MIPNLYFTNQLIRESQVFLGDSHHYRVGNPKGRFINRIDSHSFIFTESLLSLPQKQFRQTLQHADHHVGLRLSYLQA